MSTMSTLMLESYQAVSVPLDVVCDILVAGGHRCLDWVADMELIVIGVLGGCALLLGSLGSRIRDTDVVLTLAVCIIAWFIVVQ